MYLCKNNALELFQLGFKRPSFQDTYNQYDVYHYNNADWILGGSIIPSLDILAPAEVYKKGTWLPSLYDLKLWLVENDCLFELNYDGLTFRIKVIDANGKEYKAKGATLTKAFFHSIVKILKVYGENPVHKNYEGLIGTVTGYANE